MPHLLKVMSYTFALIASTLPFYAQAETDSTSGHSLTLAIGEEPSEGFDPLLGWSHGSTLLLHSALLKQNADMDWENFLT
ncbi:ABC transporter substrate-binding protein, partial [Klebsiella pneumoniae]|nr:ABC transporter substrate-binding protein [Klebsiella pneumoniae]